MFSSADFPRESIMLTGDLNIIDVEWIIQYQIIDPRAWLFNFESIPVGSGSARCRPGELRGRTVA